MTTQIVEGHLLVDNHKDLVLNLAEGWPGMKNGWMEQGIGFCDKYTHNFLMSRVLYIDTIDLKKPTERVEKQISKGLVGKVHLLKRDTKMTENKSN